MMLSSNFTRTPPAIENRTSNTLKEPMAAHGTGMDSWEYRPDVDGLRAIAVIAVVAFHAFPEYVPGGFIGVDVFFVISGFLISGIIFKHLARSTFSFSEFYSRRARRILPALAVVLLGCLVFGAWALLPDEFARLGYHTAAAAAFVANLAFWKESGYFAPAAELEPLLHLWSLGIEEQFYLVWPLLLVLAWRYRVNILQLIAAMTCGSFLLNVVLTHSNPVANFYFPVSRFWELGLGCLLATVRLSPIQSPRATRLSMPALLRALASQLPLLGTVLIIVSAFCFDSHTPYPGFAALLPACGAVCVVGSGRHSWFSARVLAAPGLVFIGLISYSLYLWHWPIISFTAILNSGVANPASRVAAVLLSLLLAILTYRHVELPIRKLRRTGLSVGLVGGAAVLAALGLGVAVQEGFPGRVAADVLAIKQGPKKDPLCLASVREDSEFNYCRRTRADPPEVVFLGDSQAQGLYEGILSTMVGVRSMLLLGRGGCPPVLHVLPSPGVYPSDQARRSCNDTWSAFVRFVRDTRPALVVLTGAGSRFFESPDEQVPLTGWDLEGNSRAFKEGLRELIGELQKYSRVVYVLEIPTFAIGPECFLRPLKLPGKQCSSQVSRRALNSSRAEYRSTVYQVQREHPGMVVIDPIPALCSSSACSEISRSGQVLYSDPIHLSPAGGRRFAEHSGLARFIAQATSRPPG